MSRSSIKIGKYPQITSYCQNMYSNNTFIWSKALERYMSEKVFYISCLIDLGGKGYS